MSRQKVESIFTTPSSPKSTSKSKPRPKNVCLLQNQLHDLKHLPQRLLQGQK